MNVWKLTAPAKLERLETENPAREEGKVRVRVTKVFLNGTDAAIYSGAVGVRRPLIPGRYAVGMVAEEGGVSYLPKGTRVLLHAVVGAPDTGTSPKDFSEDDFLLCGRTADGFLRDLINLSPENVTALPDSVNDEKALLLHHVALAKAAADKLGVKKGQHVAVVGANLLGILLCQLLIYQQAAPILIDSEPARLEFARSCGIYYTMAADDALLGNVANVTGGRLVSGAVYLASSRRNAPSVPFSVCAQHANVVLCGSGEQLSLDFSVPFRKQLSVFCVTHRSDNLEAAINLVVSGAVDVSPFDMHTVKAENVAQLLADYPGESHDLKTINVVTMI